MHELDKGEFSKIIPLFRNATNRICLNMVIEGTRQGRIFVDNTDDPNVALLCRTEEYYYYYLAGNTHCQAFNAEIADLVFDRFAVDFMFSALPDPWEAKLDTILGARAIRKYHQRAFNFDSSTFTKRADWRNAIPSGFEMKLLDPALIRRLKKDGFLNHISDLGFGYCLFQGNEPITECYSGCVSGDDHEIDIRTRNPEHRNKGFATLTASAYISHCLSNGWTPWWHCLTENNPSNAIAEKLGFEAYLDVPQYQWKSRWENRRR